MMLKYFLNMLFSNFCETLNFRCLCITDLGQFKLKYRDNY